MRRRGTTLLFIHGAGCSGRFFHHQSHHFASSLAVELPGHPNERPCDSIYCYSEWLRGYIVGQGIDDLVLVGHSMGSAIVQLYALAYPKGLRGIVLIGSGARLRVNPAYMEECRQAITDSTRWLKHREEELSRVDQAVRAQLMEEYRRIGPAVHLNDLQCCDAFDVMDRMGDIRVPALVLCGSADAMTPPKYTHFLADRIPGAQRLIVEGATHWVHLERPGEVNEAIEEFIRGLE